MSIGVRHVSSGMYKELKTLPSMSCCIHLKTRFEVHVGFKTLFFVCFSFPEKIQLWYLALGSPLFLAKLLSI